MKYRNAGEKTSERSTVMRRAFAYLVIALFSWAAIEIWLLEKEEQGADRSLATASDEVEKALS